MIRRGLSLGLTLLFVLPAGAGTPTRIQLVGEIPSFVLETRDASGTISGEVDGIAADGLAGGSPQGGRVGAKLRLSIPEGAGVVAWGHLDGEGLFVEGLPGSGAEGHYRAATPGAASDRHFEPPVEFDLTGTSDAPQRTINLAVSVERPQGGDLVLSKSVVLVKPPVVLVHGINSGPTAWTGFQSAFRNSLGFKTFAVDHSGGSYNSGAPTWGGNGDIHDSYAYVRGGVAGGTGVAEALDRFRSGHATAHPGLKIAVQKADIVASSYGGLLARWYVEQASDYADDVRKLITMGTPHRGAPITNLNAHAVDDPIIANADSQFLSPVVSVAGTLQLIDDLGFIRWLDGGSPAGVVPALQVMTVGSQVLEQLNGPTAFHDDVAYGAIVGTDEQIDFVLIPLINVHYDLEPTVGILAGQKSYFPWIRVLDAGPAESDAVVPVWSQTLPARSTTFPFDHISYHDSASVQNTISIWLQDSSLPRGAAHRSAFLSEVVPEEASRGNAYVGSVLLGTESVGGGLVDESIVHVTLSGPSLSSAGGLPVLGTGGGIVTATMTGMARAGAPGVTQVETLTLVDDDLFDTMLDVVTVDLDPGATPAGQLFPFTVSATFGRDQSASLLGPDGSLANFFGGEVWSIGYEIAGQPDFAQSPWTDIDFPVFVLPPPFVPEEGAPFRVGPAPGSPFTLEGGVHATGSGEGPQLVTVSLYEDNFFSDTLLEQRTFPVVRPPNSFAGALIPYSEPGFFLFKNGSGQVAGNAASSGETTATVYQRLSQPGASNPNSNNVTVGVQP